MTASGRGGGWRIGDECSGANKFDFVSQKKLTVGREHDFDERLVDDFRSGVDQLQDIRAVVIVPEEQQAVGQLAQTVIG